MNTTNELPPQNTDQKLDTIIDLVNSFRTTLLERMDKLEEDSRLRYVDLRQRADEMETRLTERIERIDRRLGKIEISVEDIDARLDTHIRDLVHVKSRVRELEATRELR